jgi:hypothetical protein
MLELCLLLSGHQMMMQLKQIAKQKVLLEMPRMLKKQLKRQKKMLN